MGLTNRALLQVWRSAPVPISWQQQAGLFVVRGTDQAAADGQWDVVYAREHNVQRVGVTAGISSLDSPDNAFILF